MVGIRELGFVKCCALFSLVFGVWQDCVKCTSAEFNGGWGGFD